MMKKLILAGLIGTLMIGGSVNNCYSEESQLKYLGSVTMKIGIIDKVAPIIRQKNNIDIIADASVSTSAGVDDVINGRADIVGSGGPFSNEALAKGITPTLVGSDILAIAVNKENPVKELSREQLKNILTGKFTNWSQVGGLDVPIVIFTMDKISAGYEIVKDVVLEKGSFAEKATVIRNPSQVAQNIGRVPEAIGFCSLCFMQRESNLKTIPIDNQAPTSDNSQYPLTRALYWGTKGAPAGNAKILIDFVLSEEGQAIVKQSFVGVQDTRKPGNRL